MHGATQVNAIPFEQTAAGRMTPRIPIIKAGSTLADLSALLWKSVTTYDTLRDAFVVDAKGVLMGTVTTRSIFSTPLSTKVDDIMIPFDKVVSVHTSDDQELAVQRALAHSVESVAVVDPSNKLVGAISIKELMRILQHETQEDLAEEGKYDMSATLDSILEISLLESFKSRSPWMLIGVGGGMVVAFIITMFEELLAHHIILVSFIPLVVYIAGAVSAQLQMFYIRDSAIYPTLPLFRYATRQGAVVLSLSVILAAILFIAGQFIPGVGSEVDVIAIGTGIAILSALATGVFVPLGLSYIVKDPANATAPIATIVSDTTTILIFFGVATLLLV
jgi:magnesium transporter